MERIFSLLNEKDKALPVYITGVGFEEYQDHVIRRDGFPNYHLAFCENGTGKLLIGGREYTIEKGMSFYFCPDIPHEYYPVTQPWSIRWIIFLGSGVAALMKALNFDQYEVFCINSTDEINYCYSRLYRMLSAKKATNILEASGVFYSFLSNLNNLCQPENEDYRSQLEEKLDIVTEYIKEHYQQELSLGELSKLAEVSASYLCRLFKQAYGMTPFTYIIRYRMNAAKEWLLNYPERSIKSIAIESGFHNSSYFGAAFKEYEGYTPNQFRRLYARQST